jgi:hypothetical protein
MQQQRLRHRATVPLVVLSLTLTFGATAAAQRTGQPDFHWQRALPPGSHIQLHNLNGDVVVTPSSTDEVEVLGRRTGHGSRTNRDADVYVEVHELSDGVIVCVMWRGIDGSCDEDGYHIHDSENWDDRPTMDLEVHLPRGLRLSAGSVSGNVRVDGADADVTARSVSGNVHVADARGDVQAKSVSGDVRVEGGRPSSLAATTVSGRVDVRLPALAGTGRIAARSVSGDITLELPHELDADLSMRTVSGQLDSDYQITVRSSGRRGRLLEGRIGQGGRGLAISTVSGNVRLLAAR